MEASESPDDDRILARVAAIRWQPCAHCGRSICGHEAIFSVALGCLDCPQCLECLAKTLGQDPHSLQDHLYAHVRHRDCYHRAWLHESSLETQADQQHSGCRWLTNRDPSSGPVEDPTRAGPIARGRPVVPEPPVHETWDAGDLGCGDLVLQLRMRLRSLPPGAVLHLIATDPGAPADLPAWCGLTGHRLIRHEHPQYWIQRKEN